MIIRWQNSLEPCAQKIFGALDTTSSAKLRPLQFIVGLFENSQPKLVLPMQGVMVESDTSKNYR